MVTHALYYMKYIDYIYILENGKIVNQGTYQYMKKSEKFMNIYNKFMKN